MSLRFRLFMPGGMLLLLTACGPGEDAAPEVMGTNVRMAVRTADGEDFTEVQKLGYRRGEPAREYQLEGPGWENENVGFRLYFDDRNGVDVFGKTRPGLVLDEIGIREDYHQLQSWGMDVLKVGPSLGAGMIAFWVDGEVYRLEKAAEKQCLILTETADSSIFTVVYRGVPLAGRTIDLDWTFRIDRGTHHYEAMVTARGLAGNEQLLVGLSALTADSLTTFRRDRRFFAYTYGPHAELGHRLGLGLSVSLADYVAWGELGETAAPVASSYFLRLRLGEDRPLRYRLSAAWSPGDAELLASSETFAAGLR